MKSKKNSTIKELLIIMFKHKNLFTNGLCSWTAELWIRNIITTEEQILLLTYIENNEPSMFSSFSVFINKTIYRDGYYWKCGEINPRLKWIKKHIKLNS